jgi:hypothetical protein
MILCIYPAPLEPHDGASKLLTGISHVRSLFPISPTHYMFGTHVSIMEDFATLATQ